MKMPGWITVVEDRGTEVTIRLSRFWYLRPSFWAYMLRRR